MFECLAISGTPPIQWGVVIGASLVAAGFDLTTRRIPNRLTVPLLVAGLAWAGWSGRWAGTKDALLGCLILAGPYVLLFLIGAGGAGDAKLMGGVGAWLGVDNSLVALVSVMIAGGVLAVGLTIGKRRFRLLLSRLGQIVCGMVFWIASRRQVGKELILPAGKRLAFPYGLAIFAGLCIAAAWVFLWQG